MPLEIDSLVTKASNVIKDNPLAVKAAEIFLERVLKGESVLDALAKTADIISLEESL